MQVKVEPNSIANTHQFSSPFLRMSSGNQYPRSIGNPESGLTSESSYHQPSFCNRYPHDASHPNYNYHYSAPTSSSSSSNAAQYSASNIHFNQNHMSNSDRNSGHYYPNPYKKNIATDTDEANRSRPPNLSDKLNDALKANHYKSLSNGAYNDTNAESELNDKVNESHSDDEAQDDTVANNFDDTNENSGNNLTLDDDDFIEEEENGMNMISSKSHNLLIKMINEAAMNRIGTSVSNKIRKRSANQAYEFLVTLNDSRKFQDWLSNDETDFTWVHKRNSMTNQGKKYYYICNYRIKKGYVRCPAVIYALFPSSNAANPNSDSPVMVYACGQHEHRRINNNTSKHRVINPNPPMNLYPTNTSHHDDNSSQVKSMSGGSVKYNTPGVGKQSVSDASNDSNGAYLSNLQQHVTKLLHQTCINQSNSSTAVPSINVDLIKNTVNSIMSAVSSNESNLRQQVSDESLVAKNNENLAPSNDIISEKIQSNTSSSSDQNLNHPANYHHHRKLFMINSLRNSQDAQNHSYHHPTVSRSVQFKSLENEVVRDSVEARVGGDEEREDTQIRDSATLNTTQQRSMEHQNHYSNSHEERYDDNHDAEKRADFERLQQDVLKRAANHILTNALSEFRKQQQQNQALTKTSTQVSSAAATSSMTTPTSSTAIFNRKRILTSYLSGDIDNEESSTQEIQSNLPRTSHCENHTDNPALNHFYRNVESNYQRQAAINQRLFDRPLNESIDYYGGCMSSSRPMYHSYEQETEGDGFLPFSQTFQLNSLAKRSSRHHKPKQRKELQFQHHSLSTQKTSASSTTMSSNPTTTSSSNGNTSSSGGSSSNNTSSSNSKPNGSSSPKPVISPGANSPSTSNSSNQSQQLLQISPYSGLLATGPVSSKCGIPKPAELCIENAPIHIDVGGILYTSSLETLTKYGESRLSKMFNGSLPIVLDSLKQHYFIDRDGKLFRHVLNFMRTDTVVLPESFNDFEGLLNEAKFYELNEMVKLIEKVIESRGACCHSSDNDNESLTTSPSTSFLSPSGTLHRRHAKNCRYHPMSLIATGGPHKKLKSSVTEDNTASAGEPMISDDLAEDHKIKLDGEAKFSKIKVVMLNESEGKLFISCDLDLLKTIFPEFDVNVNTSYVDKMCLSDLEPKVYLVQVIERIYDHGFLLEHYYGKNVDSTATNPITSSHTTPSTTVYMFTNKQ